MADLLNFFIDLLYPRRCRSCGRSTVCGGPVDRSRAADGTDLRGRPTDFFCDKCAGDIHPIKSPLCTVCGVPFPDGSGDDHPCFECLSQSPGYTAARAALEYKGTVREAIHLYKYGRLRAMRKFLGPLAARGAEAFFPDAEIAVAVPLHRRRLARRGFNQSLFLAEYAALSLDIPLDLYGLSRIRYTRPQVELSSAEREENVKGAFAVEGDVFEGRRVLLVDDVYTTGATVRECAKVLKKAGAEKVYVLTVARAT